MGRKKRKARSHALSDRIFPLFKRFRCFSKMESSLNILSSYPCSLSSPVNFSIGDTKFVCFLFWWPLLQIVRPLPLTLIIVLNSLLAFLSPALPPLNSSSKLPSDFVPRLHPFSEFPGHLFILISHGSLPSFHVS